MGFLSRRRLIGLAVLGASTVVVLATTLPGANAGGVRCFGRPATIRSNAMIINGTNGDDVIYAGNGNNQINARGGRDWICARGGNDNVDGGPGATRARGGTGGDNFEG